MAGQHGVEHTVWPGESGADQELQVKLGVVENPQPVGFKHRRQGLGRQGVGVKQVDLLGRCQLDQPQCVFSAVQAACFGIAGQGWRGQELRQEAGELAEAGDVGIGRRRIRGTRLAA